MKAAAPITGGINWPPVEPTDSMTGTRFVLSAFDVQAWSGSAWTTVASVSGNNLIKRTVPFTPYVTNAIRIVVNATQDGVWSRVTEIEVLGPAADPTS